MTFPTLFRFEGQGGQQLDMGQPERALRTLWRCLRRAKWTSGMGPFHKAPPLVYEIVLLWASG